MTEAKGAFLASLADAELIHFRHLALIRPQLPTESQIYMLEGLARSLASPRLLTLMARTPHWLAHWPILLGLAENEATPEAIRRDLEMVVSLFGQMREMDQAPTGEKDDRSEAVKTLYSQLNPELKPVAKLLAKQIAKSVTATGTTQELPPLPGEDPDWEALTTLPEAPPPQASIPVLHKEDRLLRAQQTAQPDELLGFLLEDDAELRMAALQNPLISEPRGCGAVRWAGFARQAAAREDAGFPRPEGRETGFCRGRQRQCCLSVEGNRKPARNNPEENPQKGLILCCQE